MNNIFVNCNYTIVDIDVYIYDHLNQHFIPTGKDFYTVVSPRKCHFPEYYSSFSSLLRER